MFGRGNDASSNLPLSTQTFESSSSFAPGIRRRFGTASQRESQYRGRSEMASKIHSNAGVFSSVDRS